MRRLHNSRPTPMTSAVIEAASLPPIVQRLLPVLGWLPGYRRAWLLPDLLAGLAVWAVMVPEGMAYAGIVGVPPIMGLYTIVPPLIAYALLGTSRLLVVGPDTATGLISALAVGSIAVQGTTDFNTLTSTLAILIGAFFLLFGALRMGWVAAFIPTPVMRGFIEGLVCVTIIGQVPHLLSIGGTSGNFFTKLWFVLQHLPDASLGPVLTGLLSLAAMQFLRHAAPRIPAALVVATVATILVALLGGEAAGISVVGDLPSGVPHLALPNVDPTILQKLAPGALAIVIAAMLHLSKPGYLWDLLARDRREFAVAAIVVAGELTLGVPQGIGLGVVLALVMLIYRTTHPHGAVLGQLPGTEAYRDIRHHPEALTFPGLLIWRPGGDLFFASIGHLGDGLRAALAESRPPAKHVLLDADSVNFIDTTACDALLNTIRETQSRGITVAFARVRDPVRERMRLGGIEAVVGSTNFHERVTDGVRAWQRHESPDSASAGKSS